LKTNVPNANPVAECGAPGTSLIHLESPTKLSLAAHIITRGQQYFTRTASMTSLQSYHHGNRSTSSQRGDRRNSKEI